MGDHRSLIDSEHSRAWTEIAIGARLHAEMLDLVGDPVAGSNFAQVNEFYPFEKVSDRARAYLRASLEHLLFFADYAAPLKFHPDQAVVFTLRPVYTIARAALESAAQAVWLVDVREPFECIRRHLALIRWDLQEHRKSKLDADEKRLVQAREDELLARVSGTFTAADIRPPGGYLDVIRGAVSSEELRLSAADAERLWRAASGVAHGKYWPTVDLQQVEVGDEYEPGHFRTVLLPDASGITEVLRAAYIVTQYGVLRYADYAGVDIAGNLAVARDRVFGQMPLRHDIDPEEIELLRNKSPFTDWPS